MKPAQRLFRFFLTELPDTAAFVAQAMKFSFASQAASHDVIRFYGDTAVIVGTGTIRAGGNPSIM